MKRILLSILLVLAALAVSCGFEGDPMIDDMYTQNVYPGAASTYSIGGRNLPYLNGWFDGDIYIDSSIVVNENVSFPGLSAYANNAAAIAGGLVAGDLYRTGGDPDVVCVVH